MKSIDKTNLLPAYHQLTTILRKEIRENRRPGDLLPSQNEMMKQYGVSYGTVMRSLMELQQEGLISRERGRGTFVNPPTTDATQKKTATDLKEARWNGKRTGVIGALLTRPWEHYDSDPFFQEMIYDLTRAASGFELSIQWLSSDTVKPSRLARFLMDRRVDGLIVFNRSELAPETLSTIARQLPMVVTEERQRADEPELPWVEVDGHEGIRLAMRALLDAGHRKIALLNGDSGRHATFAKRLEAYKQSLKEASIAYRGELVIETEDLLVKTANQLTSRLLKKKPTALIAANGRLTLGALQAIRAAGLTVPKDISLVGYDDSPLFSLLEPAITMVQQPVREFAQGLLAALSQLLKTGKVEANSTSLHPRLILRQSIAAPSGEDDAERSPQGAPRVR